MSLTFQVETVAATWNEVMILAQQHWASTRSYRRHEPFNPSFDRYRQVNESGFFQLLTAREGSVLVGYLGIYLTTSMHSQKTMAVEDTFFLAPEHRGGRNALRFIRYMEAQCQQWGVGELLFSCEADNDSGIHGLLKRLDYCPVIVQYSKYIQPLHADSVTTSSEDSHVGTQI